MTNNDQDITSPIMINGHTLGTVRKFKYLGDIISEEDSRPDILSRTAQTTAALAKLKSIWQDKNITLSSKLRLLQALVIYIFLYACESWTLTAELQRKIQAVEMRLLRRLLGISYNDHVTNEEVRQRVSQHSPRYVPLLTTVKKRKLK